MADTTILVIDDSATIRRFVDSTLSPAGYRVVLAPNAEEGIEQAKAIRPDAILLDHQLPGTTGLQVCETLNSLPDVKMIPVVVSSTLRKKAYAEYTDLPNVVDMLPKPYTAELLITTISNALETGKLIVKSQCEGTAIPEVIDAVEDADLSGTFQQFSLREVLDFLNNNKRSGVLEVDLYDGRIKVYLSGGRIQAVSGTGIDTSDLVQCIPDALKELSPVLRLTISGRMCAELDGLVELLDRKVLDPRLLKSLLRYQSAQLLWLACQSQGKSFSFRTKLPAPSLYRKLPLDSSLCALLVEASLTCPIEDIPKDSEEKFFVRAEARGQNVDRSGLSAKHLKALSAIGEPVSAGQLAAQLGWEVEEVTRVFHAFQLADLVDARAASSLTQVIALEGNAEGAKVIQQVFATAGDEFASKLIKDRVALQILLKRGSPNVMIIGLDSADEQQFAAKLRQHFVNKQHAVRLIGVKSPASPITDPKLLKACDVVLNRPFKAEEIEQAIRATGPAKAPVRELATAQ